MSVYFEELDFRQTPMGELSLRRRRILSLGIDVFEIKLGEGFLMSSLFTQGEVALAKLALGELAMTDLDVVVGGLGLGYTARAALDHPGIRSVVVIEAMDAVIEWHRRGLVPLGAGLASDERCRFIHGDFFALLNSPTPSFDPCNAGRRVHAILVDIDHSPRALLDPAHAAFYEPDRLRRVASHLHPAGIFALWSNDPPDADFQEKLDAVFATSQAHVVKFHNPLQDREAASTVYVARAQS
jgi:spermidine synthase